MPLSGPAQRTALEVLAANGVDTVIQQADGFTPTPVDFARHPRPQPRPRRAARRRHRRSRRRTIRRRMAASSTTRPTAARPTPTSPTGSRTAPTNYLRAGNAGVKRVVVRGRDQGGHHPRGRLSSCPTSTICASVVDMDAIRDAGLKLGVDPLGGAAVPLLGADQRRLRAGHHRRQSDGSIRPSRS